MQKEGKSLGIYPGFLVVLMFTAVFVCSHVTVVVETVV